MSFRRNTISLKVASEIVLRIYLTIGFVALIGLIALAATSTDGMIKRLGGARWNRLHKLVYPIAILGIIHFLMQTKLDISESVMVAGFLFWLLGYRLRHRYVGAVGYVSQIALTIIASALTAFAEAAWYGATTGVMWQRVLAANLDWDIWSLTFRPAHWVLIVGLAVTLASFLWSLRPQRRKGAQDFGESAFGRHPGPVRQLMPHPGELPLGVAARVVLSALGRLRQRDLAVEMPDQPRHAVRLHGGQQRIELARRERAHFVERARASIASKRASMRRRSSGRSGARNTFTALDGIEQRRQPLACHSESGRPVASSTSRARAIRVRSPGLSAALAGSRRASSACSAAGPSASIRARTAARISAGTGGTADSPCVSALK